GDHDAPGGDGDAHPVNGPWSRRARTTAAVLLPLLFAACASTRTLQADHNTLVTDIAKAESSKWAMQCAPRELALANSHREFAELEFQEGDARRASEHVAIAHENIEKALAKAAECEPKDRDGDGIVDGSDACPDSAEDSDGSGAYDPTLSQRRAGAVVEYVLSQGLEAKRMGSAGLGETQPIDTNRTADGRANHRRVEFHITSGM